MSNKQLYEKENNINKPFFPVVRLEDIIDTISEKSIQWILNNYNHIYVEWKNDVVGTRLSVPTILRRNGLWITYNNGDRLITEYYIGKNAEIKDKHWQDDDNWEDYTNKLIDGTVEYRHLSESLKQLFNKGNITNFPDEEDLTSDGVALSFKDREYQPENFSGLGRVILRKNIVKVGEEYKNILTQSMINEPNTIYEIRYDFDLNRKEIIIPEGCILNFQGGTLKNGIAIGNNTKINATRIKIFDLTIHLSGHWDIYEFSAEWFGAINNLSIDSTNFIQKSIDEISNIGGGVVTLGIGKFLITHTIYLKESIGLKGVSCTKFRYQPNNDSSATVLYAKFNNINSWVIDTYNYNTTTNELIKYNSTTNGNSVDTNSISSTSDVFIENLRIISDENYIFGGIRFCNSPGFHRKNITIYGKFYNGICLCSSWNGIDEDIVSEAVLPFTYLYDVNSCVIINCISVPIQNINITKDMYIESVANSLDGLNVLSKHCGLYGVYMYGVTFIGFCSEGGDIAKVYQQCNSVEDIGYYMEGIKEWYYYCQGTNLNIGKGFYLSLDNCKGIKLYLNNNVLDNMDIAQKGIEMTPYDFYTTNTPFQYLSKIVNYPSFISNLNNSIYFLSEDNDLYPGKGYLDDNHSFAHRPVIYRTLEFFRTLNSSIKNKFTEIRIAENSVIDVPNDRFIDISHITTIIGEGEGATIKSYAKWVATFKSYNGNTTFKNIKFIIDAADYTLTKSIITAIGKCNFTFIDCIFILGNNTVFIDGETSFNGDGTIKTIKSHILDLNFINCVFNNCGTTARFIYGSLNTLTVDNTKFPENLLVQYYVFDNIPVIDSRFKTYGSTSNRPLLPANKAKGFEYFDTTINKPIYWIGDKWVDATGADV